MSCLDERAALAMLEGRFAREDREALDVHLDSCEWCRRLVAEIARGTLAGTPGAPELRDPRDEPGPGLAPGTEVGRFVVEYELGRGAMGVVYAAYDPELDRRVALKLLRPTGDAAEEQQLEARLLAEARTMASLSHPHVVPVHEVGREGDAVFLAMELVDGDTLRDWLVERPRGFAELVGVLAGAGAGLAAAHAAGLVHRDFKPENVLVGRDGRARVTDFGLARRAAAHAPPPAGEPASGERPAAADATGLTRTGVLVGTPAYMAPEQLAGGAADARGDQFSFCVVLYEAVYGRRPFTGASVGELERAIRRGTLPDERGRRPPRWLVSAIRRGLAADPAARFASMDLLVAQLRRPSFVRRRPAVAVLGALAAGAAVATAVAVLRAPAAAQGTCGGAARELAGIWDGARRAALEAAFDRSASPLARDAFARTSIELDRYTTAWLAAHTGSCEATRVRGEASGALLDRRMACLARDRDELSALVDLLVAGPDGSAVEHAPAAVLALPAPSSCLAPPVAGEDPDPADPAARIEAVALRASLVRAWALSRLGRDPEAEQLLPPILARAQVLGLPRLRAEALYVRGTAELAERKDRAAASDLEEAAYAAEAAKNDLVAARAASLRIVAETDAGALAPAREAVRYAQAAVARLGGDRAVAAELAAEVAWLDRAEGRLPEAETEARAAVADGCSGAIARTAHCAHLDVLGTVLFGEGKWQDALAVFRDNLELVTEESGADHPATARVLERVGNALDKLGRHAEALATYDRAIAIDDRRPAGHEVALASLLDNSGSTLMALGRLPEAEARMRRSLALHEQVEGPDHPEVAITLVNLGNVLELEGHGHDAVPLRERALAILKARLGPDHPLVAATEVQIARELAAEHHSQQAEPLLEHALAVQDAHHAPDEPYTLTVLGSVQLDAHQARAAAATLERARAALDVPGAPDPGLLADVQLDLADALWQSGGDRTRARDLVSRALAWHQRTGATADDASAARDAATWLQHHRVQ